MSFLLFWKWRKKCSVTARSWKLVVLFFPLRLALFNFSFHLVLLAEILFLEILKRYPPIVALSRILLQRVVLSRP